MLPLFIPLIQKAIMSNQASAQHAGLTAMAILIENCHDSYKKELKNIMTLVGTVLSTKNPRLIYDVLVAMGYMAEEFAPEIQTNYGDTILQFIAQGLEHPYPKVKYIAVKCIQNFETGIKDHPEVKIFENYLDKILGSLGKIFE